MSAGAVLILSLISILTIALSIRRRLKIRAKNHLDIINVQMEQFIYASDRKDIKEILRLGSELIWNVHLTREQLNTLEQEVLKCGIDNCDFAELKSNIFNKRLDFEKGFHAPDY